MKTGEFVVVFSLCIHFVYTSSINFVDNDISQLGVEKDARQCFPGECNAHCRRLGHARGVCIGNFCQCRLRSLPLAELKEEVAIEDAVEAVDKTLVPINEETLVQFPDTSNIGVEMWGQARQCFPGECNAHCRRLGHARGVCIGNFCQCRLRSSPVADVKKEASNIGVEMWGQARQCFPGECNAHCRRLGHARGVCIGNFCQCRLRSSPVTEMKKETPDLGVAMGQARQCFPGECNAHCRRLGHARGVCIGNFCQCRLG